MKDVVLNCVIVDDSATQRTFISKLVDDHPNIILQGTYANGLEAYKGIDSKEVDLVFLDIEMPLVSGFDLAACLEASIQIIVTCSNGDYALQAFNYDVTDFLKKPIASERFYLAVQRAITNHRRASVILPIDDEFIYVRSDAKDERVVLNQINWVEALGDYIKVITEQGNLIILSTMKSFSEKLPKDRFIRIHRSYTVNIKKVEKFSSTSVEICGNEIPMSRKKKNQLEKAVLMM